MGNAVRQYGARTVPVGRELRRRSRPHPVSGHPAHPLHRFSAPYTHLACGRASV